MPTDLLHPHVFLLLFLFLLHLFGSLSATEGEPLLGGLSGIFAAVGAGGRLGGGILGRAGGSALFTVSSSICFIVSSEVLGGGLQRFY